MYPKFPNLTLYSVVNIAIITIELWTVQRSEPFANYHPFREVIKLYSNSTKKWPIKPALVYNGSIMDTLVHGLICNKCLFNCMGAEKYLRLIKKDMFTHIGRHLFDNDLLVT